MGEEVQVDNISTFLKKCEDAGNITIFDSFLKSYPKIQDKHGIVCSISGGADSDIMLDIIAKLDPHKKVKYVFFDTGIEYQATKQHLEYLEKKYGITIDKMPAITPVPLGCKRFGVPFWSKHVSEMIERLQKANFTWEDKPLDELLVKYPTSKVALRWWCNDFGEWSRFNINYVYGLKEYLMASPPPFRVSNKCCKGAKKDNAKKYLKENKADLNLVGIRKAEGGVRSSAYKSCFDSGKENESWENYRPIFWYQDDDKKTYERLFGIDHSDCYSKYGLTRTGCAGCPFGKGFEEELRIINTYEPKLFVAVNNIFGESYEYTRKFYEFREGLKTHAKSCQTGHSAEDIE